MGRLCRRNPRAAHSLSSKQQEMVDSWQRLLSRAQKWYEPSLPSLTHPQAARFPLALVFP